MLAKSKTRTGRPTSDMSHKSPSDHKLPQTILSVQCVDYQCFGSIENSTMEAEAQVAKEVTVIHVEKPASQTVEVNYVTTSTLYSF